MRRLVSACILVLISICMINCVERDPQTGEVIPQGDQRFPYATVKERAERLAPGMSRTQVMILLGSPARRDGDDWVYRDDRDGILIPAEAMRVTFDRGRYVSHKTEPIILGQ